jgi:hypothetical protein
LPKSEANSVRSLRARSSRTPKLIVSTSPIHYNSCKPELSASSTYARYRNSSENLNFDTSTCDVTSNLECLQRILQLKTMCYKGFQNRLWPGVTVTVQKFEIDLVDREMHERQVLELATYANDKYQTAEPNRLGNFQQLRG